jgi:hypothetical protein
VGRLGGYLKRPAQILAGCVGALIVVGLLWAAVTGADVRHSVADALFVGGVVIVVFAVGSGGGARGQRMRGGAPSDTPFGTVALGVLVVLVGIAVLKVF